MLRALKMVYLMPLAALFYAASSHANNTPVLAVIVSEKAENVPTKNLAANELNLIFWRKKEYWPGGVRIHPVNLHATHALRLQFSNTVLGSVPAKQIDYWNGLYYHGISPPYSVQSEEAVLRYVSDTKGAIGYVDACKVDARVKPLLWIENGEISTQKPNLSCDEKSSD
jgi:ABC-type phosphate transport system substrate-binding protein